MPEERMTLIERLRNPDWTGPTEKSNGPHLRVIETRTAMNEAADALERKAANENDQWRPYKDDIYRAAKAVLANYDEFGVEYGLDEYMEGLRKTFQKVEEETR